jgi:hypothetical protein
MSSFLKGSKTVRLLEAGWNIEKRLFCVKLKHSLCLLVGLKGILALNAVATQAL